MRLAHAHLSRPRPGETENGDAVFVRQEGPLTLMAVVDALGHGPAAASAARAATRCLAQVDLASGVFRILGALHGSQAEERGVGAGLCLFDGERLCCAGVGNVEMRTQHVRIPMVMAPGILGQHYRRPTVIEVVLRPGDRFALFSDGLTSHTDLEEVRALGPEQACALLLQRYARPEDDASILIADVEQDP